MSELKDSEIKAPSAETETPTPAAASTKTEKQIDLALGEPPKYEPPKIISAATAPAIAESEPVELPKPAAIAPSSSDKPAAASIAALPVDKPSIASIGPAAMAAAKESRSSLRANRFALLAASVAFAAAIGALTGALAASVFARSGSSSSESPLVALDLTKLQDAIASVRNEVAALKTSVDSGARSSSTQFAKAAERIERIERTQSASAAQLSKSIESIERHAETAKDVTGSVRPQAQPQPAAAIATAEPLRGPVLDGWVVRHINRNVAYIQGRRMAVIQVEAGDIVPGVGRIQSIRRQPDGRLIVVTSKGLITSVSR